MATNKKKKAIGAKKNPVGRFEYKGSEFKVYKDHIKINDKKWRKLKKVTSKPVSKKRT